MILRLTYKVSVENSEPAFTGQCFWYSVVNLKLLSVIKLGVKVKELILQEIRKTKPQKLHCQDPHIEYINV